MDHRKVRPKTVNLLEENIWDNKLQQTEFLYIGRKPKALTIKKETGR